MDNRQRVREYLISSFKNQECELGDEDDFFALGYVDSLFAMQLVLFLEKDFGVSIEGSEMRVDNFRTVNAICGILDRKFAAHTA